MKIKNGSVKPARIEMLPLIDIVFLLLVFFIYAMLSMAVHRGLQLDLPESTQAEQVEEHPLSIAIKVGNGSVPQLFVNEQPVALADLMQRLNIEHNSQGPLKVLLFAEETLSYQQLYLVLDELKRGGIEDVSLQASSE